MRIANFASASLVLAALALGACASAPQKNAVETQDTAWVVLSSKDVTPEKLEEARNILGVELPVEKAPPAQPSNGAMVVVEAKYAWVSAKNYPKVIAELEKGDISDFSMNSRTVDGKGWMAMPRLSFFKDHCAYVLVGRQHPYISKLEQVRGTRSAKVTLQTVVDGVVLVADARQGGIKVTVGGCKVTEPIAQTDIHETGAEADVSTIVGSVEQPQFSRETATLDLANTSERKVAQWKTYEGGPYRLVLTARARVLSKEEVAANEKTAKYPAPQDWSAYNTPAKND